MWWCHESHKNSGLYTSYQAWPGTIGRIVAAYKSLNNLTGWQSPFHELGWPALIPLFYVLSWELRWYNRFSSCLCFTRWKQWWSCEVGLVVLFCQVNYNSTILHSITVSPTEQPSSQCCPLDVENCSDELLQDNYPDAIKQIDPLLELVLYGIRWLA